MNQQQDNLCIQHTLVALLNASAKFRRHKC